MPSVRRCPRCGSLNPARSFKCQDCRASLSGTVPFDSSTVKTPEALPEIVVADDYEDAAADAAAVETDGAVLTSEAAGEASRYYGVHGWLKFIVVGNLYIAPVLIAFQYLLAWAGFLSIAEDYPGILIVGLALTVGDGALTVMGIQAAIALRDVRSGAVQKMKYLLQLRLGWAFFGGLIGFIGWSFAGLNAEAVIPDAIRNVVVGGIAFTIGWTYFSVSRRVKATYPDWRG